MIIVVSVSSVYNICFLLEDGTPIIILVCVNDNCRGRFICHIWNRLLLIGVCLRKLVVNGDFINSYSIYYCEYFSNKFEQYLPFFEYNFHIIISNYVFTITNTILNCVINTRYDKIQLVSCNQF